MADDDIVVLGTEMKLVDAEEETSLTGGNVKHKDKDNTKVERSKSVSDLPNSTVSRGETSVSLPLSQTTETITAMNPDTPRTRHQLQKGLSKKDLFNPLECSRLYVRRNALCDPEKMPMPQPTRERIQRDVETRRKSLSRKLSNYLSVHLNLGKEEDLI